MVNTGGHAVDTLTGLLIDHFNIANRICILWTEKLLPEIQNFDTLKFEIKGVN